LRNCYQVDMVGHKAIKPYFYIKTIAPFGEFVPSIVGGWKKQWLLRPDFYIISGWKKNFIFIKKE
jgi:hypothetical protein